MAVLSGMPPMPGLSHGVRAFPCPVQSLPLPYELPLAGATRAPAAARGATASSLHPAVDAGHRAGRGGADRGAVSVMNGFRRTSPTACSASSRTSRSSPDGHRAGRSGAHAPSAGQPDGGGRRAFVARAGCWRAARCEGRHRARHRPDAGGPSSPTSRRSGTLELPRAWRRAASGIVLGTDLARALGVGEGDSVTLIAPSGQVTPLAWCRAGKQMTVVGTFSGGHHEYDSALAMLSTDARAVFRLEGPPASA